MKQPTPLPLLSSLPFPSLFLLMTSHVLAMMNKMLCNFSWCLREQGFWRDGWVSEHVFVFGVNIGVKCRGHADTSSTRGRRRRARHVHVAEHKSVLIGCITTASSLASFLSALPHLIASLGNTHDVWKHFPLLRESLCPAACTIQAYWVEETQFGSSRLPTDQHCSSHCRSL